MKNRKFLMLAMDFNAAKHRVAGNYMSEKLDGMRAIWIPQTVGLPITDVFFANTAKKKKKFLENMICTGLWSRYGNIVFAPPTFTSQLPHDMILDGELNFGRGGWNRTVETVRDHVPGPDWANIKYSLFDSPTPQQLFADGRINEPNYAKTIHWDQAKLELGYKDDPGDSFSKIYEFTRKKLANLRLGPNIEILNQELLPFNTPVATARFQEFLHEVLSNGGEGVILRYSSCEWEPQRSAYLYRAKAELDSEAQVIGFTSGEEGKHLGRLGSLRMLWGSVVFDLSGFTDAERELSPEGSAWASANPGELDLHNDISLSFYRGQTIQFKYREVTPDGKPKEARFHRIMVAQ